MAENEPLVSSLQEGRKRFLDAVGGIRAELHRYCARMTGSVADAEDIVQETLARAYYALSEMAAVPPLRPWLFRIAHHRALDHLRRYERRYGRSLDESESEVPDGAASPEDRALHEQAANLAIRRFCELPPAQRATVVLKDVLGHSLDEIAQTLALSDPAVKAALHRGRQRLRQLAAEPDAASAPAAPSPAALRYAALFNARDWDAVRAMLAEDVELDLVSRARRRGRVDVSDYFTNYDSVSDWHLVPGSVDGQEVLLVFRDASDEKPAYFVELTLHGGRITLIKDFRYVPYILEEAETTR